MSELHPEGVYNPALKFAITNITDEDHTSYWDGSPITIKAGQTVSLDQNLADKITNELINKIIIEGVKTDEVNYYKANPGSMPNAYRASNSLGVPAVRKELEDKICRPLKVDEETPEQQALRAQLKAELEADLNTETSKTPPPVPSGVEDFSQIQKDNEKTKVKKAPIKPMVLKEKGE